MRPTKRMHAFAVEAEGAPGGLFVERAEAVEVDAAGHDGDAVGRGAVELDEGVLFVFGWRRR